MQQFQVSVVGVVTCASLSGQRAAMLTPQSSVVPNTIEMALQPTNEASETRRCQLTFT
jgi:hypothetical protein